MNRKRMIKILIAIVCVVAVLAAGIAIFLHTPPFGRLPQGERLERIRRSPNFRDGEFRNLEPTALMTSEKGRWEAMLDFVFKESPKGLRPEQPVPAVKTDLRALDPQRELLVWFGHSSYLLQLGGKRVLVDPVFCGASPVSFVNKPFPGTDIYRPEDMPDIDYLVITHDHWDHLDYETVTQLKGRIRKVVCPLGVGEHFEYWGFEPARLVELDWNKTATLDNGFTVHCLPARHFSGRGLKANRTLWASFLLEASGRKVYIGGDSGYGPHYADIGKRFPHIDLAVLENGQYNVDWRYIHTLPKYLGTEAKALGAKQVLTVHHSKYALAHHRWDEPLENARKLAEGESFGVLLPAIGEVVDWTTEQNVLKK